MQELHPRHSENAPDASPRLRAAFGPARAAPGRLVGSPAWPSRRRWSAVTRQLRPHVEPASMARSSPLSSLSGSTLSKTASSSPSSRRHPVPLRVSAPAASIAERHRRFAHRTSDRAPIQCRAPHRGRRIRVVVGTAIIAARVLVSWSRFGHGLVTVWSEECGIERHGSARRAPEIRP